MCVVVANDRKILLHNNYEFIIHRTCTCKRVRTISKNNREDKQMCTYNNMDVHVHHAHVHVVTCNVINLSVLAVTMLNKSSNLSL